MAASRVMHSMRGKTVSGAGVIFFLVAVLACLYAGFLIGVGQGVMVMLLMAMILSVVMLAYPIPLMWTVLLGTLVVAGTVSMFFPELGQIKWGVSMLGIALVGSAVLNRMFQRRQHSPKQHSPNLPLMWMCAFFSAALLGSLYARHLGSALIGFKSYFQAYGLFLALSWLSIPRVKVDRMMKALVVIALIQLPFALYQFFILGSKRIADSSVAIVADAVVGTFPVSTKGGGAGAVLSALLIIVACMLLYWWRKSRISTLKVSVLVCICLIPVFLNETKISLLAIPLGLFLVFSDKLKKNPLEFLAGAFVTILFLAVLFMVYVNLPAGSAYVQGDASLSFQDSISYNIGEKGYGSLELNRTTIYPFWAKHHGLWNPVETLFGHGLGSSDLGGNVNTNNLASLEYRGKGIGLTTISALLWDVGLIGVFAVVAMFWTAFRLSGKILANSQSEDVIGDGLLMGTRVGIAILGLSLIHNNYFTFEIGYQTLLMLMFGYVAYRAQNQANGSLPAVAASSTQRWK
ncbi:MAG: hypothetical protein HOP04_14340 [Methylophilaceae bacterium]|nr:hypothetical protein [Methylophilaceae bacterium]